MIVCIVRVGFFEIVDFVFLELFFGFVDGCDFGMCVNDVGNCVVVYVFGIGDNFFDVCDFFFGGFMC